MHLGPAAREDPSYIKKCVAHFCGGLRWKPPIHMDAIPQQTLMHYTKNIQTRSSKLHST